MASRKRMVNVEGTARKAVPDAKVVGTPDPNDRLRVSVYVRPDPKAAPPSADELGAQLPGARKYLTHEEATKAFGADPADLAKVEAFAREHGLAVTETCPARRLVAVSGTVAQLNEAFGVEMKHYEAPGEHYRGREGSVQVPEDLAGVVEAVLGLDNRRVGRPFFRKAVKLHPAPGLAHATTTIPPNTYFPPQVARLYNFPPALDGTGQTIAILVFNESGGGYSRTALQKYFGQILNQPMPDIHDVVVHGQGNDPHPPSNDPNDGDVSGEVMLDIQVAGSVAPGAKLVMYFTEFTLQGWVDVISRVVTDAANGPSVLSISYGNPEVDPRSAFTTASIKVINRAFQRAAAVGITVCCASGDDGSRDQSADGRAHADFPASSPFVLGCGGTRLESANGVVTREVVWNDAIGAGGGGVSAIFPVPTWQTGVGVPPSANPPRRPGRGVPDVSGLADPITGYQIIAEDGSFDPRFPTGGTSATAPLWAALVARINQGLGARVGFLNPILYQRFATGILRDVTQGSIGAYDAGPGWDACTGLGSPDGVKLLNALRGNT
ncbi:MAG TPA: S53 family peptidase [Urbifossiella sp.]|jgi:kumamolisin|nr:S53 family peptidase [Urbifossiella sp.]